MSEDNVPNGYEVTGSPANNNGTITNTHEPDTTTVTVTKVWEDEDDQDGIRLDSITVQLTANGEPVEGKTVTLDDTNKWTDTWEDLDKNASGTAIDYSVDEVDLPEGYEADVVVVKNDDGTFTITITNIHEIYKTTVTVTKEWSDNNNQDGKRPSSISVQLMADGTAVEGKTATLTADTQWSWTWNDVPMNASGKAINYSVEETEAPDGYKADVSVEKGEDGTFVVKIVNTHEPEKIDINGKKTWDDKNNQDGKRPTSITINLLADGKTVKTITVKESDGWKWSFTGLDKYADGKEIKYTITENPISGYVATVKGFDVTNTRTYDKLLPTGQLKWPIPVFGGLGLLLAGYGVLTLLKKRKDEET